MKSRASLAALIGVLGTLSAGLVARDAAADDLVIRNATVHTAGAKGTLEHFDVVVRGGTIVAVVPSSAGSPTVSPTALPPGATIIDAKGRPLTPGLCGGISTIGLEEVSAESSTVDSTLNLKAPGWEQQWHPELDVTLAFNPRSTLVPVTRVEGVTWTMLAPNTGDTLIAGQASAVTLDGRYDAVLGGSRSLFVTMGNGGARHAGGTRAAEYMLLEQAIREARTPGAVMSGALLHAAGREAFARYLAGGRVVFEVDRAADILSTIAFARRNGMKPVIFGGGEAWVAARELAKADVPVILDPLQDLPVDFDRLGARLDNAALLYAAGVRIAFYFDGDPANLRLIRQLAGNAVAHGLPWDVALAAITSSPAEIFGLGATRGRIAVGQVADLVLWSADPLEVSTLADQVWIAGRPVEMRSRQTELRDRYLQRLQSHQAR